MEKIVSRVPPIGLPTPDGRLKQYRLTLSLPLASQNSAANASSGTSPDNAKAHDAASAKSSWLVSENDFLD